ncbi:hypothetical protein [Bombiscardovia coagulans]|uniref:Lipoprotein n=1 Tax=Bombiscardovia coagulans TaxID=686666 RepID=A0A261EPJ0_9BIFI|nr:hypothetical protein [Bombiscardovia coagulans]OZG48769.1 hypothetical protein BOCO_1256 [Bombiscardovia coagulans]
MEQKLVNISMVKVVLTAFVCILLMVSATGCSAPWQRKEEVAVDSQAKMASSLKALFDEELASDKLSAFEREVLERAKVNGTISAEDYETAHNRQNECMGQAGWKQTWTKLPNGLYQSRDISPLPEPGKDTDRFMKDMSDCSQGVSKVIESLYSIQQSNPDLLSDPHEAAASCIRKAGMSDATLTGKKLKDALDNSDSKDIEPKLHFNPKDPTIQACLFGSGIAYQAE